ncbi:MAG: DNA-binding transcriptional regulator [Micropruina glycogenica]
MAPRKSERIMNLAICLLLARRFLDKNHLREVVEGYGGLSDAAFERTFERDKDDLRAMGVPVETGSNSTLFPDEIGYRIRRQDFELPPIDFTAAEATALGLASQVWGTATLAEHTVSALAKLRAAGVDPDASRLSGLSPSIGAKEAAFEPLWQATMTRTVVAFGYRGVQREVEPWILTYRRGSWPARARPHQAGAAHVQGGPARRRTAAGEQAGCHHELPDVDLAQLTRSSNRRPPTPRLWSPCGVIRHPTCAAVVSGWTGRTDCRPASAPGGCPTGKRATSSPSCAVTERPCWCLNHWNCAAR